MYAIYKYFGLLALSVSVAACVVLVLIGYAEAEKEEKKWDKFIDKVSKLIAHYLKYVIRGLIFLFSLYTCYTYLNVNFNFTDHFSFRIDNTDDTSSDVRKKAFFTNLLQEKVSNDWKIDNFKDYEENTFTHNLDCPREGLAFYGYGDFNGDNQRDIAIGARNFFKKNISNIFVLWGPLLHNYSKIDGSDPFRIVKYNKIETHRCGAGTRIMYWNGDEFKTYEQHR